MSIVLSASVYFENSKSSRWFVALNGRGCYNLGKTKYFKGLHDFHDNGWNVCQKGEGIPFSSGESIPDVDRFGNETKLVAEIQIPLDAEIVIGGFNTITNKAVFLKVYLFPYDTSSNLLVDM
jgi:hypothetical protein